MGALEGGRRGERAGEGGLGHIKQLQGVGGGWLQHPPYTELMPCVVGVGRVHSEGG